MMPKSEKQTLPTSAEWPAPEVEPQPQNPDAGITDIDNETKENAVIWDILIVDAGKDVMAELYSFVQDSECVGIVSAVGTLSSFTIRKSSMSAGTTTHEGTFDIVNCDGILMLGETVDKKEGDGWLKICVVGKEEVLFGGMIAGPVITQSRVQIALWTKKPVLSLQQQMKATQAVA